MNILPCLIVGDSGVPYPGRELNSQGMCEAHVVYLGFPHGSVGKESTHNAGYPGLIPGRGRSPGERNGNPLQYSWSSFVAQMVKNLPAIRETWVRSLGREDPLEKGKYYPLQYSGLKNSNDYSPWGRKELDTTERLSLKFKLSPQTKFSAKLRAFSKSIFSIFKFLLSEMSIFFLVITF